MRQLLHLLNRDFEPNKQQDMAHEVLFLGVISDLSRVQCEGVVTMTVPAERTARLCGTIRSILSQDSLSTAEAASLAGRLWLVG